MASAAENEATKTGTEGTIAGVTVTVPPVREWRASAIDAMSDGRFTRWAESVLSDEDADKWLDADPTIGDVEDFFEEIGPSLGMGSAGKSRASRRSSKNTQKR